VGSNDRSSRNNAPFADPDPREDDASKPNPHSVANHDGPHIVWFWRMAFPSRLRVGGVTVGIHDQDAAREVAIASYRDALSDSEVAIVADAAIVPDFEKRVVSEPSGECD
jgi:hypothetical protein